MFANRNLWSLNIELLYAVICAADLFATECSAKRCYTANNDSESVILSSGANIYSSRADLLSAEHILFIV